MEDIAGSSSSSSSHHHHHQQQRPSIKKFIFGSKRFDENGEVSNTESDEEIVVIIPERLEASYGLYVWPSAHVLSWYLFQNRNSLKNIKILELGAGTSLPGILAALCGACVTLSDSSKFPHCLEQCRKSAEANGVEKLVKIVPITWGSFTHQILSLEGQVDLLIGSDLLYDPSVFDDLLSTVSFILESNPEAHFLCTYQERSSNWSIVPLLSKWNLTCTHILYTDLANSCQIDLASLTQGHTIHLLQIKLKNKN